MPPHATAHATAHARAQIDLNRDGMISFDELTIALRASDAQVTRLDAPDRAASVLAGTFMRSGTATRDLATYDRDVSHSCRRLAVGGRRLAGEGLALPFGWGGRSGWELLGLRGAIQPLTLFNISPSFQWGAHAARPAP
jgi:hypothetical protein